MGEKTNTVELSEADALRLALAATTVARAEAELALAKEREARLRDSIAARYGDANAVVEHVDVEKRIVRRRAV